MVFSEGNKNLWLHDEHVFADKLREWGVTPRAIKLVVLDSGLGDHLVFKSILPELKSKYKDIVIANCYPAVFEEDTDVTLISIAEAMMFCNTVDYNVYKWMWIS